MSIEAYVWVTHYAPPVGRDGKPLRPVLRNVLYALADHAGRNGRGSWPSAKTIAGYLNMKKNNVYPLLDQLQEGGWISRGDQRRTAHLPENVRPVVYDLNLSFVRRTDQTPSTADTPSMADTRSTGETQGSTAETPGVCAVDQPPSTADTQTVLEPSTNRPEPAPPGGDHRRQGDSRKLTARERLARKRAEIAAAEQTPAPDARGRDRSGADAPGMDDEQTTGTGGVATSPQDFVDVPLPYADTADTADEDQDTEGTDEDAGHDGGPVAPGDSTEDSTEPEDAVRPPEPSNTPEPHTGTRWAGKRLTGTERAERDQVLAAAHADGESMRAVATRFGVSFGTVQGAVRRVQQTDQADQTAAPTVPEDAA